MSHWPSSAGPRGPFCTCCPVRHTVGLPLNSNVRQHKQYPHHSNAVKPQPLIAVRDVQATSAWYQHVLGLKSGHGGTEYEQLLSGNELVLQVHEWDAHEHPNLGNPKERPYGNGVVLWFYDKNVAGAFARAVAAGAEVLEPLNVNPLANHREFWLRDPNGYKVVVAGAYGDIV
jgi:catechol 2,3-dioxygenase-like lactoylglutathione lyase family enzyme